MRTSAPVPTPRAMGPSADYPSPLPYDPAVSFTLNQDSPADLSACQLFSASLWLYRTHIRQRALL